MIKKIEVWGDSILKGIILSDNDRYVSLRDAGCVALAAKALNLPIVNHSHFGMTSEKGKEVLRRGLEKLNECEAVLIGFGGNDIDYDWEKVSQTPFDIHTPHTSPERFELNVEDMVNTARADGQMPILCTLPPICSELYCKWIGRRVNNPENIIKFLGDTEAIFRSHLQYNNIIESVAEKLSCLIVDLRTPFLQTDCYSDYLCSDGIHPNAKGHILMKNAMINFARKELSLS